MADLTYGDAVLAASCTTGATLSYACTREEVSHSMQAFSDCVIGEMQSNASGESNTVDAMTRVAAYFSTVDSVCTESGEYAASNNCVARQVADAVSFSHLLCILQSIACSGCKAFNGTSSCLHVKKRSQASGLQKKRNT